MSHPDELLLLPNDPTTEPPKQVDAQSAEAEPGQGGSRALELAIQKVTPAVQRALQMASYLPAESTSITRVAVVSADGKLIASVTLESESQARFLLEQLQPLGFEERRSTGEIQNLGCDLLLVHAASLEAGEEQGIVRGLNAQRWPPEP